MSTIRDIKPEFKFWEDNVMSCLYYMFQWRLFSLPLLTAIRTEGHQKLSAEMLIQHRCLVSSISRRSWTPPPTAACHSWAPSLLSVRLTPALLSTNVTLGTTAGWMTALRPSSFTNVLQMRNRWKGGRFGAWVTSAWAARSMFSCFWRTAFTRSKNSTLSSEILPRWGNRLTINLLNGDEVRGKYGNCGERKWGEMHVMLCYVMVNRYILSSVVIKKQSGIRWQWWDHVSTPRSTAGLGRLQLSALFAIKHSLISYAEKPHQLWTKALSNPACLHPAWTMLIYYD